MQNLNSLPSNLPLPAMANSLLGEDNGSLSAEGLTNPDSEAIAAIDGVPEIPTLPANPLELAQSFVVLKLLGLVLGTPGSDAFVVGFPNKNDFFLGRQGSDVLLAVDPGAENPGQGEIDTLAGDLDLFEVFPLPGIGPQEQIPRSWQDKFILGDRQKPYYIGSGSNDYAKISDFEPDLDIIQLHGTPQDYQLIETPNGTELFWQQEAAEPDLIASLPKVFGLSLNDRSFKFEDAPPPESVVEKSEETPVPDPVVEKSEDAPLPDPVVEKSEDAPLPESVVEKSEDAPLPESVVEKSEETPLPEPVVEKSKETPVPESVVEKIEQLGTAGVDFSVGAATDNSDGVYLTGTSAGSFWVAKYDSEGNQQWLKQAPSTGNVDTDNSGNVYVGGGLGDVTLTKYDSEGNQQWTQSLGTFTLDNSFNLDVDDSGNTYLTGYTLDNLGGENANELAVGPFPVISTDSWLAKYDSEGNQQWLKQFGSGDFDEAFAIATDSDGNAYTSGWTFGDLGGTNAGLYDVWVAKHDSEGNQQWLKQFGTADYDWAWDAATDNEENVYITGWTLGDLGETSAGSYDGWVAKYDSDGNQQWLKQLGTAGDDVARSIDVDELGNFYVTGYTDADFGGSNTGSYDTWVAKYDRDGNQQWQQQFGTSEIDNPFDLTVNSNGQIFVTGFTEGSLGATNAGSYDAWSAKLSSTDGSLLDFSQSSETASLLPDLSGSPEMLS